MFLRFGSGFEKVWTHPEFRYQYLHPKVVVNPLWLELKVVGVVMVEEVGDKSESSASKVVVASIVVEWVVSG